jgi:hypothetical protein
LIQKGSLSAELEEDVMNHLLSLFTQQLNSYPTRLIDDEYVLYFKSKELTPERYLIRLLLQAEKSLLIQYIEALNEALREHRPFRKGKSFRGKAKRVPAQFVVEELRIDRFGNCTNFAKL